MRTRTHTLLGNRGQTTSEYAVVLSVISITVVASVGLLSLAVAGRLGTVAGFF